MVPDQRKTSIGMEYFCDEGDAIWSSPNDELIELAKRELEELGLARAADVEDGVVIRQPKAYPVYDAEYRRHLDVIQRYLATFTNLQTTGRNGMHRYNNQDHSMLTGMLAVKNLLGEEHDLWNVNTERSYYEEFQTKPSSNGTGYTMMDAKVNGHARRQGRRQPALPSKPRGTELPAIAEPVELQRGQ